MKCVIVNMVQQPKGVMKVCAPIWFNVKLISTYSHIYTESQNTVKEDILSHVIKRYASNLLSMTKTDFHLFIAEQSC